MKHFLTIEQLSVSQIKHLIARAFFFKQTGQYPCFAKEKLVNLFYENSTRTRVSFELAAHQLGIYSVNLTQASSSETKGEQIADTIETLAAMGIKLFVIRHQQDKLLEQLTFKLNPAIQLINAGDGKHAHPSQALLDLMTILEHKPNLESLKITIIGDLRHSRVANSLQCLLKKMQIGHLTLVAPPIWQPKVIHHGRVVHSLEEGLADADIIICLRIQQERLLDHEVLDLASYRAQYSLTKASLAYAKKDAQIMHPGPINRGIEIDSAVADGPQSLILNQVTNGVFMRMAILESLLSH